MPTRHAAAPGGPTIPYSRPAWMTAARCARDDVDPDDFTPDDRDQTAALTALGLCGQCPVTVECLTYAYHIGDTWSILGGTTAQQRGSVRPGRQPRGPA